MQSSSHPNEASGFSSLQTMRPVRVMTGSIKMKYNSFNLKENAEGAEDLDHEELPEPPWWCA